MSEVKDITGQNRTHDEMLQDLQKDLKGGPGGPYDGDMEKRVSAIEAKLDVIDVRIVGLDVRMGGLDKRMDSIDKRLDRIEGKALTEWAVAKVMFFVLGFFMTALIFAPRLLAMLPQPSGSP
jgi:hypothetical protein